ncbi:MAG TPA: glycoside hydrolase domain-containing protein [Planctomycetota bacterium]|nr:glycoside hydrolase domain-containing protein [Planctomycetota bacterium]
MRHRVLAWTLMAAWLTCAAFGTHTSAAPPGVVLDETCVLRQYYRFDVNRYDAGLLKSEGLKILGRQGLDREKRSVERALQSLGIDPRKVDWREHAGIMTGIGARAFPPVPAPAPPSDWTKVDFDDGTWVRKRGPFQSGPGVTITTIGLGQFDETMDLRLVQAYYRARFIVTDPAKASPLSLRLVYTGGVRVFLNGEEIARAHLPKDTLDDDTPADVYDAQAYGKNGARHRDRTLAGVKLPREKLRTGVNVLAVENRSSRLHPVVMTFPTQPNWGGPMRPWPHAKLSALELRAASSAVPTVLERPPGVQVWVEDANHRTEPDDFLPPGEAPGILRIVAARNGTFAGQVVVGTDRDLADLSAKPGPMRRTGGNETLPDAAVDVRHIAPYPADKFTLAELGDERGLDAKFPAMRQLASLEGARTSAGPHVFDHLIDTATAAVAANSARPMWVSFRIPADAAPGTYTGDVTVSARGMTPVRVPVELEVVDWTLGEPKRFQTFVGCEQNPYGVAKQYGVKLWSQQHFRLMEASFVQLGRVGNRWLNVPVLRDTEFGNHDDSLIRWVHKRDGSFTFDFTVLDRYLDLAAKHCGPPRVVCFIVMHGMPNRQGPPYSASVSCEDERSGRTAALPLADPKLPQRDKVARWQTFAKAAFEHMKSRGLEKSMWWGYPLEGEADPELKQILAQAVPDVTWVAGPHEMMANGTFAKQEQFYKLVADIRYHGRWPSFRDDMGWKSRTLHLNNPRAGGTCIALHTTSLPFGYRLLADRCIAMGRNGFTRVAADDWAAVHYDGMTPARWLTGIPVLFVLWPGRAGAESSVRFETMLEGIQEAEARIFIEQAIERGKLPQGLAARARKVLKENFDETTFLQGNSIVRALFENHARWQERSRRLYRLVADVARASNP